MTKKLYIAVDLGGTGTKCGIFTPSGKLISKSYFYTEPQKGAILYFKKLKNCIDVLLRKEDLKKEYIEGIGMGSPGPLDVRNGIMLYSANFPGWKDVDFRAFFKENYNAPSYFENDVNLVALGEYNLNFKDDYKYVIVLTLGTGLGGAYIEKGHVLHGKQGFAGEFGHIQVVENGIRCGCGSHGCLEAYVSASGIKKRLFKLKKDKKMNKRFIKHLEDMTPKAVYKLAEENNGYAIDFFKETGYQLGKGLKTIVNIFNPDLLAIGGGMSDALKYILPEAKHYLKKNAFKVMVENLDIEEITFSEDSALYGGYLLVKNENRKLQNG